MQISASKRYLTIFFLFVPLLSFCGRSTDPPREEKYLTVGTFNLEWLGDGVNDINPRDSADFARIAEVMSFCNADVWALQEIENESALQSVAQFLPQYSFFVGKNGRSQNLAVFYRKDLQVTPVVEYMPVAIDPARNRPGYVVLVKKGSFDFLMMAIHLKSTSRHDSSAEMKELSYAMRKQQSLVISQWIDSTLALGKEQDIIVLGDFNDSPNRIKGPTLDTLVHNPNVEFVTKELRNCKNPKYWSTIDHVAVSSSAGIRYVRGSAMNFDPTGLFTKSEAKKISDHCPVIVKFKCDGEDND